MNTLQNHQKALQLSDTDVSLIIKALEVYDKQVAMINTGVFPVSADDLSDINNDSQYLKGLKRHLETYITR
jgi:hypothetical protein